MLSYGSRRAISELLSIFASQWSDGMLPHIRFAPGRGEYRPGPRHWGVPRQRSGPTRLRTSGITQPPLVGMCAWEVFARLSPAAREVCAPDFLLIARGLERFHEWLLAERDPWGESLALCVHPWETGTDNSPAFDTVVAAAHRFLEREHITEGPISRADTRYVSPEQRPTERDYYVYYGLLALFKRCNYTWPRIIERSPFLLQDPMFNSLLSASLQSLADLQDALANLSPTKAEHGEMLECAMRNRERAGKVASAVRRKLWNERQGFFVAYDCRDAKLLDTLSVSGAAPLMSGIASGMQAERITARLSDPREFGSPVPLPSTPLSSPHFSRARYWSGPAWPVTNWVVYRGLSERGSPLASNLCMSTLRMIEEGSTPLATREAAARLLRENSVGEEFTVPSRRQYAHAWLWDSAIAALGWTHVGQRAGRQHEQEAGDNQPLFWEYYDPLTGEGLGATRMTWTAALYLELEAGR